jgi:hypothetical protein
MVGFCGWDDGCASCYGLVDCFYILLWVYGYENQGEDGKAFEGGGFGEGAYFECCGYCSGFFRSEIHQGLKL